jgi:hypothetical protein
MVCEPSRTVEHAEVHSDSELAKQQAEKHLLALGDTQQNSKFWLLTSGSQVRVLLGSPLISGEKQKGSRRCGAKLWR